MVTPKKKRLVLSPSSSPSSSSSLLLSKKQKVANAISKRKRQRCESLHMDAHSYGAYVWRERDLRNALKWFDNDDTTTTTTKSRHEFLQTLLCSRGILEYRPIKQQQQQLIDGTTKNNHKEELWLEKQKPLIKTILLSMTDTDIDTDTTSTTSKDKNAMTECPSNDNQPTNNTKDDNINDNKNSNNNNEKDQNHNDAKESWRKNHILRKNLHRIIQNRTITNQLYTLCDSMSQTTFPIKQEKKDSNQNKKEYDDNDDDQWSFFASQPHTLSQNTSRNSYECVSHEAIQYFSSSQTAVRKTYASQLCDRLVELQQQQTKKSMNAQQQGVEIFLEKLQRLAENDSRIQETILFLLLESYTRNIKRQQDSNNEMDYDPNDDFYSGQDVDNSMFAFIPQIESLILSFASNTKINDHQKNDQKDIGSMGIWGSPSPLLCSVCHSNTRMIAQPYIKYLIISSIRIQKQMTNSIANDIIAEGGLKLSYNSDDEEYVDRTEFDSKQKLKEQNRKESFHQYQDFILRLRDLCSSTTELKHVVSNLFETFDDWSKEEFPNKNKQNTLHPSKERGMKNNWNIYLSSVRDDLYSILGST